MQRCLIVVDYQNDFVSGSLGFSGAELLDSLIAEKIQKYRAKGDVIIFTFDTHGSDYLKTQEGKNLAIPHCIRGTIGHNLYGETAKLIQDGDNRFYKGTFGSSDLYEFLKTTPFERIEIVGLVSNICVISNAVLAKTAQPETPIVVDSECTASHDPKLHQAALDIMIGLQIRVARKIEDKGPFYHGTKAELSIGDILSPGLKSNYGEREKANYIYFTSSAPIDAATWAAELAEGEGRGRIYIVEPIGEIEDDPNLTDKKFPGNITKSYRSREPLRIVGEVTDWIGHTPEELRNMRQNLEKMKKIGIEAIND
jgi:nicotinamidase-related amidase